MPKPWNWEKFMDDNFVKCPYCGTTVRKKGLAQHQRTNVECQKAIRVQELVDEHFVLVDKDSPIYTWATTYLKDEPIWEYDGDDRPYLPTWFCELWFRAEKSPVTGRLTCSVQSFLDSIRVVQGSELKRGGMTVQARLRDVGYFGRNGGIYKSDCQTPLWLPPNGNTLDHRNGAFTREDLAHVETTLLNSPAFQHTRYERKPDS